MKINILRNQQDPFSQTILYAPELELSETNHVAEKCFPAVRFSEIYPMEYFFILESEVGSYQEYSSYPQKSIMYSYFGGKEELEQKFQNMFNKQMKNLFIKPEEFSLTNNQGEVFKFRTLENRDVQIYAIGRLGELEWMDAIIYTLQICGFEPDALS